MVGLEGARFSPSFAGFGLVGESVAIRRIRRLIAEYGPTGAPVLVTGETGTGKELVARGLHSSSSRASRTFVPVNCAAVASSIFESELFGSKRGSFTGADRDRDGLVGAAQGGTLFLDEIGELPLDAQPKLLRLLESGLYRAVGAGRERSSDVRIVAATNRELDAEVGTGSFRADLYFRIDVLHIHVPPLRSRREDVRPLVRSFLERRGTPEVTIRDEAFALLEGWRWPGNVRELGHVVERTLVRKPRQPIEAFDLGSRLDTDRLLGASDREREQPAEQELPAPRELLATSRREFLSRERSEILHHLNEQRWNVSATARALGWTRGALRRRMRALGLEA